MDKEEHDARPIPCKCCANREHVRAVQPNAWPRAPSESQQCIRGCCFPGKFPKRQGCWTPCRKNLPQFPDVGRLQAALFPLKPHRPRPSNMLPWICTSWRYIPLITCWLLVWVCELHARPTQPGVEVCLASWFFHLFQCSLVGEPWLQSPQQVRRLSPYHLCRPFPKKSSAIQRHSDVRTGIFFMRAFERSRIRTE